MIDPPRHAPAHEASSEAPLRIELPEPCLVVLVGAAGSGKSTLAAGQFATEEVLSSDAYRGLVAGDPADQAATPVAFRRLHADLHCRLAERRTTVVDATNVTAYSRRSLTRIAARHACPAIAILLDLPAALVLARNATREGRIVPEAAVRAQLADLARSLRRAELDREGFAAIHHLRAAAELDRIEVVRRRS